MGILLLSISHKTAPAQVRGWFAYQEEQQQHILGRLVDSEVIEEAVILSTCNRTELYCSSNSPKDAFRQMENVLLEESSIPDKSQVGDYILRFQGERAVHHLFKVTAGLDSMVIGEDQILGQVKQAYFMAQEGGFCHTVFHTLFRLAITAAKKVKTDTVLSKTSVSTAGLALKKAEECHGSLDGKKLLIIGASGKIGDIVLKDALDIKGLSVYVTVRQHLPRGLHNAKHSCQVIPYEERYHFINDMDVVISATSSPHYTIMKERFLEQCTCGKKRVFFDLAVPFDIEESIAQLENTFYYNMEDMAKLAQQNNERKLNSVAEAKQILKEYEEQFYKWFIFGQNRTLVEERKTKMLEETQCSGCEKALDHFFYGVRSVASAEELASFMRILQKLKEE